MTKLALSLASALALACAASSQAAVIVGPTTFPNGTGYPDTSWGIEFTAVQTSALTGFDFHHRDNLFNPSNGTITLFDVTSSTTAFTTPWGPDNTGLVSFSGLNVLLTAGHVYQLTATSSVGAIDERFQYQQSGQFSFPTSNADISVTKGFFSDSDNFTRNNAWAAFGNITTAAVPEPASLAIWSVAALGGAVYYRRRNKARKA